MITFVITILHIAAKTTRQQLQFHITLYFSKKKHTLKIYRVVVYWNKSSTYHEHIPSPPISIHKISLNDNKLLSEENSSKDPLSEDRSS